MKIMLVFFALMLLRADSFNDLIKFIDNSNIVKIYKKEISIQKNRLKEVKAKNLGELNLEYDYIYLFDRPVMKLNSPQPIAAKNLGNAPLYPLVYKNISASLEVGKKNNFTGSLIYSYPLFTGYAITNLIEIEKLNLIKKELELENIKRSLKLQVAKIYSNVYSFNKKIDALKEAKYAIKTAKEKAFSLYKEGLINKSMLDEIDAKYFEVVAYIDEVKSNRDALLNNLSYLINKRVLSIGGLPSINLKKPNFFNRPDIKKIKKDLNIASKNINLNKSSFYPKIYFQGGIKKEATNFTLSKNDYKNVDNSFLALSLKYNIFDGGEKEARLEEAKIKKNKAYIFYRDYLNKVKVEYKNDLLILSALKKRLVSVKKEINARNSYYEYIRAKFNEGLADVTDLNDAIAKLAQSKAKKEYIKSQIFFYSLKANLDGGSN